MGGIMRVIRRLFVGATLLLLITISATAQTWTVQFDQPSKPGTPFIYAPEGKIFAPDANVATSVSTYCCGSKKNATINSRFKLTIYNTGSAEGTNSTGDYLILKGIGIDLAASAAARPSQTACCNFPNWMDGCSFPACLAEFLNPQGRPTFHPRNIPITTGPNVGQVARYSQLLLDVGIPDHDVFAELSEAGDSAMYPISFTWLSIWPPNDCVGPQFGGIGGAQAPLQGETIVTHLPDDKWQVDIKRPLGIIEYGNALVSRTSGKKTTTSCVPYGSQYLVVTNPVNISMVWARIP
jgi:hypothetical protein